MKLAEKKHKTTIVLLLIALPLKEAKVVLFWLLQIIHFFSLIASSHINMTLFQIHCFCSFIISGYNIRFLDIRDFSLKSV